MASWKISGLCMVVLFLLASSGVNAFQLTENDMIGTETELESSRNLLMKNDRPLCLWNNRTSECGADVIGNVPNKKLTQERNYVSMCAAGETQESCEALKKCVWIDGGCNIDIAALNGDCFDPAWNTVSRSLQCTRFGTKDKCNSLTGCIWKDTVCEKDAGAVKKATKANKAVGKAFSTFETCLATAPADCKNPCFVAGGECVSLEIFDGSNYILEDATSPYCGFHNGVLSCIKLNPEDCAAQADCQRTPVAGASCNLANDALIRIAYAEHPKIQKKMQKALETCPTLTTEGDCFNFK